MRVLTQCAALFTLTYLLLRYGDPTTVAVGGLVTLAALITGWLVWEVRHADDEPAPVRFCPCGEHGIDDDQDAPVAYTVTETTIEDEYKALCDGAA